MGFGGYSYGPTTDDEAEEVDEEEVELLPEDNPGSRERCDHPHCERESPPRNRLCEECTEIMRANTPNTCSHCGASVGSDTSDS